jgi:hypothetical protein
MSWQWPPDQMGARLTQTFDVISATACGADPSQLVWQVSTSDGPTSADFSKNNPALIETANYGSRSDPQFAQVTGSLLYAPGGPDEISLEAAKQGDVVGPAITPASANVTSTPVMHC